MSKEVMMQAVIQHEFGSADVLKCEQIPRPSRQEGEVLIKVAYASINYADLKTRVGGKGEAEFPFTLGLDAAGMVEEASESSVFSPGDRVIAFPKSGSYAQYAIASEALVFKIPDELSFEQAAAMPTVAILSYMLIHEIGRVKASDTVVIHSAGGGVGSMLVQLAKQAGVENVMGTVGSLDKKEYVESLGADAVFTYDTFSEEVLKRTKDQGADVIFDSMAGDVTERSLACLALYGTLVQFGNSSGKAGSFKTSDVHSSCRSVKGFSLGTTRKHAPERLAPAAAKVIDLFAKREVNLSIQQVFDLKNAADAHRLVESRNYEGKILLKVL